MKGILRVSDSDSPVVIHGVQYTLHPPVHLDDRAGSVPFNVGIYIT